MTYIELINDFWQEFEDEALKPNDALLYLYLLKVCNSKAWQNPFELSNKRIRLCLEMTDKSIIESRERLAERGLVKVVKGDRNRVSPKYKLLHFCFPSESKKRSKKRDLIIDKDIDYLVVDELTREEFFNDFFSETRKSTIDALCMNNHTDESTLRRVAKEVLDDWQGTSEPKHRDLHEAQKHLLNQIRVKLGIERREQKPQPSRPATANRAADKAPRNVNDSWADFTMPTE